MVDIAVNNEIITFDSVESIIDGLEEKGNLRIAAIEAAVRYVYPEDHLDERQAIILTIYHIGQETQDSDTWAACWRTLWPMNMLLSAEIQRNPPRARARVVS